MSSVYDLERLIVVLGRRYAASNGLDPEDLVQESWLNLLKAGNLDCSSEQASSYVGRVVQMTAYRMYKERTKVCYLEDFTSEEAVTYSGVQNKEKTLDVVETLKNVLNANQFDVVFKYYGIGCVQLNTCEIAKLFSVSPQSVTTTLRRACEKIRRCIDPNTFEVDTKKINVGGRPTKPYNIKKAIAIRYLRDNARVVDLVKEYGISQTTINRYIREYRKEHTL